jgi:large subunit ribosomal protein L3
MNKFMLGKKAGMTQLFDQDGNAVPVTVIECGPIDVIQRKTTEIDAYESVKVGFAEQKAHRVNRPEMGQYKKAEVTPKRFVKEFRVAADNELKAGETLNVADCFEVGDRVDVSGVSKGKGYAGNVKRHNQKGGREGHGSKYHRRVGSLGPSATPARVLKGTKLPGQLGNANCTVQNLEVVMVDGERNILALKGAVPGIRGGYLTIVQTVKGKKA